MWSFMHRNLDPEKLFTYTLQFFNFLHMSYPLTCLIILSPRITILFSFRSFFEDITNLIPDYEFLRIKSVFHWQFLSTYIFSVFLKFRACCITGQWGDFTVKNATLYLHMLFWRFFVFFFIKKFVFLSLSFLFLMKYRISATEYWPIRNRNRW